MIRKMPKWIAGAALALIAGAAPLACGGGGGTDNMAGAGNDEDGTGGNDTDGTGGKDTDGTGGNDTDGSGGNDGEAGADGTGGTAPADASIDDLISAICEWEFGCCDAGEAAFRLGTAAGGSVEDCVSFFTFQLHDSNATANPFPAGSGQGLLGVLGYTVDLTRVNENPSGIGECVAAYEDMGCPTEADTDAACTPPDAPDAAPCALVNLFDPKLVEGDECTLALTEGGTNDVECPAGTTCLDVAANDPDNPNNYPTCVQRGEEDEPCFDDADCDYNFYCAPNSRCAEKGDEGDDCTFNDNDNPMLLDEDAGCKAGLKCDPDNLVCVNMCEENYPCSSNAECPEDTVCAPVTITGDSASWHQCRPTGTGASDRCDLPNEDADCADNRYCDGSVCQGDLLINSTTCSRDEMCESGSFCDLNGFDSTNVARTASQLCVAYQQAGEPCFYPSATASSGCGPDAPLCLQDATDGVWKCSDALKDAGDVCVPLADGLPPECEPGLICELVDAEYKCSAGADLEEDCDDIVGDDSELDCGVGLTCDVDDICIEQLDAGGDCEDPEVANTPKPSLCKNGSCVENWDDNGPDFICTDAPVPESNGGDNLTCGG
jgi:hypothetical protein